MRVAGVRWFRTMTALLVGAMVIGCAVEEKRIGYRPMLGGLPGAEGGYAVSPPRGAEGEPRKLGDDELEITRPDGTAKGSKVLLARTARHVMVHIANTVSKDDSELFVREVLSERTKAEYFERGLSPSEAFTAVKAREAEVLRLFNLMPMGEYTPGLFLRGIGGGVQRLEVTGKMAQSLVASEEWTGIDVVMERGNYRLLWFVTPGR